MKKKDQHQKRPVVDEAWLPLRRGPLFCSPACGCRCLHVDYVRATKGAKLLLKLLKGNGWHTTVWENAGWHFKAESGPLAVFGDHFGKNGAARYACTMIGRKADDFMSGDPNETVEHTVNHCIVGACRGFAELFEACTVANMKPEFFRVFTQLPAIEFLRHPGGRSIEGAARFALGKDPNHTKPEAKPKANAKVAPKAKRKRPA